MGSKIMVAPNGGEIGKLHLEITERLAELETEMEQKLNQWTEATEELENCQ